MLHARAGQLGDGLGRRGRRRRTATDSAAGSGSRCTPPSSRAQELLGLGPLLGIEQAHVQRARADRGLELARRALGDHLAVVDHGDPVGELVGLVEVLGAEQDRGALRRRARG